MQFPQPPNEIIQLLTACPDSDFATCTPAESERVNLRDIFHAWISVSNHDESAEVEIHYTENATLRKEKEKVKRVRSRKIHQHTFRAGFHALSTDEILWQLQRNPYW